MCNNNHWNIAQVVPDCQLKTRACTRATREAKGRVTIKECGPERAEQALSKAASDRSCRRVVALLESTIRRTAHRGGTEVDWEESHRLFHSKPKWGRWSPDGKRYRTEMKEKVRVVVALVPPCPWSSWQVYRRFNCTRCSVAVHVMLKRRCSTEIKLSTGYIKWSKM